MATPTPDKRKTSASAVASTVYNDAIWKRYAQVYDELITVIPYQNLLLELVDVAQIEPGMRLFDGCCGTGNLLWALSKQNVICDVTEIDYSKDMLARAKAKSYEGNVELVRANLDDPTDDWGVTGTFDRLILNNCLPFLSDPAEVLRKLSTIAHDSSILVVSTLRPNPNVTEILEQHLELSEEQGVSREEALRRLMPKLQPIIKSNEEIIREYGDSYHLPSIQQLRAWFEGSGWSIESVDTAYSGQNWLVIATKNR